jgi:hypothetical protein
MFLPLSVSVRSPYPPLPPYMDISHPSNNAAPPLFRPSSKGGQRIDWSMSSMRTCSLVVGEVLCTVNGKGRKSIIDSFVLLSLSSRLILPLFLFLFFSLLH